MGLSSGAVRAACHRKVDGRWGPGSTKLTWKKLKENNYCGLKPTTVDPQERSM